MSYCSTQDLIDRFGQAELISLTEGPDEYGNYSNSIDQVQIDRALSDAAATLDGYLAARYPLPLDPVPAVLNRLSCDIARYFLHDRNPLEEVTNRYKDAIRYLERVNSGAITLGIDTNGDRPETHDAAVMESAGSVFGRKDTGFI